MQNLRPYLSWTFEKEIKPRESYKYRDTQKETFIKTQYSKQNYLVFHYVEEGTKYVRTI